MNILLTGGAGYIGTHTAVELLENGYDVVVIDNLCNSKQEAIRRVEKITSKKVPFYHNDIRSLKALDDIFRDHKIDAVIHFAGLKAVGESVRQPLDYYDSNVSGTINLLEAMRRHSVNRLVFSSSATVYGDTSYPYKESEPVGRNLSSPYGQTKYIIEQIMKDTATADSASQFVALRYFNPVGAHESGLIGEDPQGIPNNLMPFIAQVASGKRDILSVFGDDYETKDGTCVRDFIHVVDLAKGHLVALQHLEDGFEAYNLGSGKGTSVMELINAFENACGKKLAYEIVGRRAGDLPEFYANVSKAKTRLKWQTKKTIDDMCIDTWRWQSQNPNGYSKIPN